MDNMKKYFTYTFIISECMECGKDIEHLEDDKQWFCSDECCDKYNEYQAAADYLEESQ